MKILLGLHIILLGAFIRLGFYLMEVKERLVEDFFEVGWENYEGPSLDVPSNIYSSVAMILTLYAIFIGRKLVKEAQNIGFLLILLGIVGFVFAMVMFFQDGATSVKESIFAWQVYAALVGLFTIIAFFANGWPKRRKVYHNNILDDFNEH